MAVVPFVGNLPILVQGCEIRRPRAGASNGSMKKGMSGSKDRFQKIADRKSELQDFVSARGKKGNVLDVLCRVLVFVGEAVIFNSTSHQGEKAHPAIEAANGF